MLLFKYNFLPFQIFFIMFLIFSFSLVCFSIFSFLLFLSLYYFSVISFILLLLLITPLFPGSDLYFYFCYSFSFFFTFSSLYPSVHYSYQFSTYFSSLNHYSVLWSYLICFLLFSLFPNDPFLFLLFLFPDLMSLKLMLWWQGFACFGLIFCVPLFCFASTSTTV